MGKKSQRAETGCRVTSDVYVDGTLTYDGEGKVWRRYSSQVRSEHRVTVRAYTDTMHSWGKRVVRYVSRVVRTC